MAIDVKPDLKTIQIYELDIEHSQTYINRIFLMPQNHYEWVGFLSSPNGSYSWHWVSHIIFPLIFHCTTFFDG